MKLVFSKALHYIYLGAGRYRTALADFFLRKSTVIYVSFSVLLNLCTWFLVIVLVRTLGDNLAITHYTIIFGIDRINSAQQLFTLPLSGLAVLIFNVLIGALLVRKNESMPGHQLLLISLILNAWILVATYLLYAINFS